MPKAKSKVRRGYGKRRGTKRKYKRKRTKSSTGKRKRRSTVVKAKRAAKVKRRLKVINKTIRRVQTKLADQHVSMRRMHLKARYTGNGNDSMIHAGAFTFSGNAPVDGELVNNENYQKPIKYDNWFNIDDFHGYCIPRGYTETNAGTMHDPRWEQYNQWSSIQSFFAPEKVGQSEAEWNANTANVEGIDIMALREIEIPFVPCIPSAAENTMHSAPRAPRSELAHYTREGDTIRVTQNYMRFQFYAKSDDRYQKFEYMAGDNYADMHGQIDSNDPNQSHYDITGNNLTRKSFTINAPRVAKARIIVVKRKSKQKTPILLTDFMKTNNPFSMGDEMYRMNKYFHRGRKTKSDMILNVSDNRGDTTDITIPAEDVAGHTDKELREEWKLAMEEQELLNDVTIVYDRVHRLKMNSETTVKLSCMKGKVLHYEPNPGLREVRIDQTPFNGAATAAIQNTNLAIPELDTTQFQNHVLPVSTNGAVFEVGANQHRMARSNEYCPNEQYACFLLLMNVRSQTEYSVFQKFDYDT